MFYVRFSNFMREKMADKSISRCQNTGCGQDVLSTRVMDHIQKCYYREVECHEYSNVKCQGEKIPLLEIPKHYKEKHGIPTSQNSRLVFDLFHGIIDCDTFWGGGLLYFDERYFMTHALVVDQQFNAWVTILGSLDEAERYQSKIWLGEKSPDQRTDIRDFVFNLPVYPHQDIPRCPSLEESSLLTELISLDTLQKLSVPRTEILDEDAPNKYSFKVRFEVSKEPLANEDELD